MLPFKAVPIHRESARPQVLYWIDVYICCAREDASEWYLMSPLTGKPPVRYPLHIHKALTADPDRHRMWRFCVIATRMLQIPTTEQCELHHMQSRVAVDQIP